MQSIRSLYQNAEEDKDFHSVVLAQETISVPFALKKTFQMILRVLQGGACILLFLDVKIFVKYEYCFCTSVKKEIQVVRDFKFGERSLSSS